MELIRDFFAKLSNEDKLVASAGALMGWFNNLFLLDLHLFTWEFIVRGCMGLSMSVATLVVGLVVKDFYAIKIKHKIFKHEKNKKNNKGKEDQAA